MNLQRVYCLFFTYIESPLGKLQLTAENNFLNGLYLPQNHLSEVELTGFTEQPHFFEDIENQLMDYFVGTRFRFNISLRMTGTIFQKKVWQVLQDIPFGETKSYEDIALHIQHLKAYRAVGNANGHNPISIIVPCHRVCGKNGLGGYSGGLEAKKWLLQHEQMHKKP